MLGLWLFLFYIAVISIFAVVVTIYDKKIAERNGNSTRKKRRVPERTLFMVAAMGGSVAMYITMKKIRHKTKHKQFMIGIPAIIIIQVIAIALLLILV